MNSIPHGVGINSPPATATVPHERRGELAQTGSKHAEATVLTLTPTLAPAGKPPPAQPGLAALYALLRELQGAEMDAVPARTAQMLAEVGRHFLSVTELGNSQRLRNHILGGGLFLDANEVQPAEAEEAGGGSGNLPAATDLKGVLVRILALLQPGRQLTLRNGTLQFASLYPGTAQCLQAYNEEQKQGSRQKQLQARLVGNVETALLGIVRNQLQSLAQSSEKKTRWIMELLIQRETGPVTVPLTLSQQAQTVPEIWEAEFELDLRHCGPLHVVLGVKNSTVSVSLAATRLETLDLLRAGKPLVAQILGRKGMTLGSYVCLRGQHERLAG